MLVLRMISEPFHRDVEGRPLREGRTPAEHLKDGDIEYRTCPYAGSRQGKPMNASALRQTSAHWDDFLDALAFLRAAYAEACGSYTPDVMDLWRVAQLGSALPWWYLFHDGAIPAFAAALSKATLGLGIWAQRVQLRILAERWTPPVWTSQAILDTAEQSGTLVGDTEVCAGGDRMLLRFFDAITTDAPGRLAAPKDRVLAFGAHYTAFKQLVWMGYLARRYLHRDAGVPFDEPVQPSDFFIADVPPPHRAAWFRTLADLVVPFAGEDALRAQALAIGEARTLADLRQIFAQVLAIVERAFCTATGQTPELAVESALDLLVPDAPGL